MADSVQHALDRMVADLDDLRNRGIFSEMEVRSIVAKRREFEYLLRRHEARKLDYMRYVEYEMNLDSLRSLRTKRIDAGRKKKKKNGLFMSDTCCTRLIRWIFDRAVLKFPSDVDLWLHYIDFAARQGQSKTLGRLCARALQLHPRNAGLWIKAASWEFFEAGNTSSARALMQRGLRINPLAQQLWLQYFRLEFYYVEKIMGRREILGLEDGHGNGQVADNGDASLEQDQENTDAMDIPRLEGEGTGNGGPSFKAVKKAIAAAPQATPGTVMNETARKFYRGAVPLTIYRNAIKAVPDDVDFRAGFLRCCARDFPGLGGEVAEAVVASVVEDFPESVEAWELRAMYPTLIAEGPGTAGKRTESLIGPAFEDSKQVFEQAVEAIGAREPDIWVRYATFLQRKIEEVENDAEEACGDGDDGNQSARAITEATAPTVGVLLRLTKEVLTRATEMHVDTKHKKYVSLAASVLPGNGSGNPEDGQLVQRQKLATGKEVDSDELENNRSNAREALGVGLADVCLALDDAEAALAALRATTVCLPTRSESWRKLASLHHRLSALGDSTILDEIGDEGLRQSSGGGRNIKRRKRSTSADRGSNAILREALRAVHKTDPGYPALWRDLLGSLLASGAGKKAISAGFRSAVEACAPTGKDPGDAQGEFLTGYLRWTGVVEGAEAARRALQWARQSFLLSGSGALPAYLAAIETERTLGDEKTDDGTGKVRAGCGAGGAARRVRDLYEDCTNKFGHETPGVWEEYAQFEMQEGDVKRGNAVRWRAQQVRRKAVDTGGNGTLKNRQRRG